MKKIFYNPLLFAAIAFCGITLFSSCSKNSDDMVASTSATYYFTNNTVNRDLVIRAAIDDGADITANFNGLTFHLSDTSKFSGSITASNDLLSVHGTWFIDDAYDKITFNFPTNVLPSLAFLNKQWQFMNRNSDAIDLRAANGENDEVHFVRK
jgi:hypothetical protein